MVQDAYWFVAGVKRTLDPPANDRVTGGPDGRTWVFHGWACCSWPRSCKTHGCLVNEPALAVPTFTRSRKASNVHGAEGLAPQTTRDGGCELEATRASPGAVRGVCEGRGQAS